MSGGASRHRLEGLEADNLLAFLALLGVLRALDAADSRRAAGDRLCARAAWDLDVGPLRPVLHLARQATQQEVSSAAAEGVAALVADHDFGGRQNLDYKAADSHRTLEEVALAASQASRGRADLFAALMSDAAVKLEKAKDPHDAPVDPTPLCLLWGQGWQYFLERLAGVPALPVPSRPGHAATADAAAACLGQALFAPWRREDATFAFRWDPDEDVRYALQAGDPTDDAYKSRTQHGANRLAAVGLAALPVAPEIRAGRVRPTIPGGAFDRQGFSFAWPVWRDPAPLSAVRGLLAHPDLRRPGELRHLSVAFTFVARRIANGKFMNFTRAEAI